MKQKDEKILEILKTNARATCKEISKRTGLPITTVHNRIKKMEKDGIIKGYRVILDQKKRGYGLTAFILLKLNLGTLPKEGGIAAQDKVTKSIGEILGVEEVHVVTGEGDVLLKARAKDIEDLNRITANISIMGVEKTNTMVVLNPVKDKY